MTAFSYIGATNEEFLLRRLHEDRQDTLDGMRGSRRFVRGMAVMSTVTLAMVPYIFADYDLAQLVFDSILTLSGLGLVYDSHCRTREINEYRQEYGLQ